MSRYIDADALIAWIKESQQMTSKVKAIICKIESMVMDGQLCKYQYCPNCDAVEVVRCRECKHRQNPYAPKWCYEMSKETDAYDYCSYGERKEGE